MPGLSPSRSIRTEESMAIIAGSNVHRIARCASAEFAHDVVGGHARRQLETPACARNRIADILAQDDAPTLQLHLEQGALGQPQRIAHRLGQGDLAAFGDGGFHDGISMEEKVCMDYTYFRLHAPVA